jgi:NTE family protein
MTDLKHTPSRLAQKISKLKKSGELSVLTPEEITQALEGVAIPDRGDAVFEGGGVKGIALVGALYVAEHMGVKWQKVAGTSAGAITACLLAAGYTAKKLIPMMTEEMDFTKFMDQDLLDKIPLLGKIASALFEKGIYEGDYFENWIAENLSKKGVNSFGDLKDEKGKYRLKLIASDVTRRKMLVGMGDGLD